jgi:hypothetical protein
MMMEKVRQTKAGRLPVFGTVVASRLCSKFRGCARHDHQIGRTEEDCREQAKK